MSEDGTHSSQMSRFLVSPVMVKQPTCVLPPGTVIKSLPIQVGSFVLETPKHLPYSAPSPCTNVFPDLKAFDVKVSTKGRRPKHSAPEVDQVCELGPAGMMTDRPKCTSCGKYFMSRQQLNQHMLVHTDVRKYKCTYCERTFKQPSHLHQHHRIHTGEKPYKCPIPGCSRAFPQQSNLNHHLRNHDKPAPPPENTCSLCMRTYASETVLRSHISKIHMCDPDALLGLRIKAPASDFYRSPNVGMDIQAISDPGLKREMVEKTNNKRLQHQTVLNEKTPEMFVTKQEPVDRSIVQPLNITLKSNSGNGVPDLKQDNTELYIHEYSKHTLMNENISKPINLKSTTSYSNISGKYGDILNRSFEPKTEKHSFSDDDNDVRINNGNIYASETSLSPGLKFPAPERDLSHSDNDGELTETAPLLIGRSRKRKAFQPHRIVKTQNVND